MAQVASEFMVKVYVMLRPACVWLRGHLTKVISQFCPVETTESVFLAAVSCSVTIVNMSLQGEKAELRENVKGLPMTP